MRISFKVFSVAQALLSRNDQGSGAFTALRGLQRTLRYLVLVAVAVCSFEMATFNLMGAHAWSANTGWIAFVHDRPSPADGVVFGGAFLSGFAYSGNVGWIHFGDGMPANGHTYANDGSDHGVNHDGSGNLSGLAWSANAGWINFGWAAADDPFRPRVDFLTGAFSGFAWGANIGWINLGTGMLATEAMVDVDVDTDGLADWWERLHFGDLAGASESSDFDRDTVPDLAEYLAGTDPTDATKSWRVAHIAHRLGTSETTLEFSSTPSRLYRIEYSSDLGAQDPWTDSSLGTFAPDPGNTTVRTFSHPRSAARFFRIVSVIPLRENP
jgi:hypothetical protein